MLLLGLRNWRFKACLLVLIGVTAGANLRAITMNQLLSDRNMTPKKFAAHFENFKFARHPFDVQNPKQFLSSRKGDCIDYAVLADHVLKRRNYTTRLMRVEMAGKNVGHAICYVNEDKVYLDYNNRAYFFNLIKAKPTIREVAEKVADSFDANWTFAQEFTFNYDTYKKYAKYTVVKIEPKSRDPDRLAKAGEIRKR